MCYPNNPMENTFPLSLGSTELMGQLVLSLFEINIIRRPHLYAVIPAKAGIQNPRTPSHNSHS